MWVGPGRSAADLALLRSRGITHVLKRGGDVPNRRDEGIVYLRLDVGDSGSVPALFHTPKAEGVRISAPRDNARRSLFSSRAAATPASLCPRPRVCGERAVN